MEVKCKNNFLDGIDFFLYTLPRIRIYQIIVLLFVVEIFFISRPVLLKPGRAVVVSIITYVIMTAPVVLGLFLLLLVVNIAALLFNKRFFDEKTIGLSETGVKVIVPGQRSETDWGYFKKVKLTKRLILFYTNERCALFVPKRSFSSQSIATEFYQYALSRAGK